MTDKLFSNNTNNSNNMAEVLEINNLILSYGFYVDLCDADAVANLWTEDGEYIVNGIGSWKGHQALKDMVNSPMHKDYVSAGCMHFMGSPQIKVNHNEAYARSNTLLIKYDTQGFAIDRVSNNVWHFRKTDTGWKVVLRENTLLAPKEQQWPRHYILSNSIRWLHFAHAQARVLQ